MRQTSTVNAKNGFPGGFWWLLLKMNKKSCNFDWETKLIEILIGCANEILTFLIILEVKWIYWKQIDDEIY